MIRPDLSLPIPDQIHAAHFIGIGGSGMSGLARMFLKRGIRVSGSDPSEVPPYVWSHTKSLEPPQQPHLKGKLRLLSTPK